MTRLLVSIFSCFSPFKQWFRQKCLPSNSIDYFTPPPLIQTLGKDFPLYGRSKAVNISIELFDKQFADKALTDRNCHPFAVIAGSPSVGKTRLLLELPIILNNHIQQQAKYKHEINPKLIPLIFRYNNGNTLCELDYTLPIECVLSLRLIHAFTRSSQRFSAFARDVPEEILKDIYIESTLREIVSFVNENNNNNNDDDNSSGSERSLERGRAGGKGDLDSSRDKLQGIYIGLDEFNRLIEERGADVDINYLYKVSIDTYTYTYTYTFILIAIIYT